MWAISVSSGTNMIDRIYRDGTMVRMGQLFFGSTNQMVGIGDKIALGTGNQLYYYDPITWTYDFNKPLGPNLGSFSLVNSVIVPNRAGVLKVYRPSFGSYARYDLQTMVLEATVPILVAGNIGGQIHWLQDQQIVAWNNLTGEIVVWDVDAEVARLRSFVNPGTRMVVDRTHSNVITVNNSKQTEIYELSVAASAISALTFTPNNFDRFHGEEVSVTITGSNGELVKDQDIEWSVVGLPADTVAVNSKTMNTFGVDAAGANSPAKGCIHPRFTKTDAAGIARAKYCPPGNDWVMSEREVVSAKVVI